MQVEKFLKNKIERQIKWNGQGFTFIQYVRNSYGELTEEILNRININGIFHEGGGYGGMLNFEMFGRDGGRTVSKMKPMILCLYSDGLNIHVEDEVKINDYIYNVVEKNDIKNLGIAFEISLEINNAR